MSTQAQAIAAANQLIGMMQTLETLRRDANELLARYNSEGYAAYWQAFATASENPDGSLGGADGTPNPAHPITVGSPMIGRSANALLNGVTLLQDFIKFCTNQPVSAAQRSQTIDDLVS